MAHGLSSTLRALAWLRWRLFLNGAVHGMRRDMLRRFAGWAQPVVFVAMSLALVPAAIVLSGVALFAGFAFADGSLSFDVALPLLRIAVLFFVVGGIVMPIAYGGRAALPATARLLLLPVDRRWLHRLHTLGGLFEPLLLLGIFPLLLLPLGMAAGGAFGAAASSLAAGVGLVLFVATLGSWLHSLTVLLLRRRQRAQKLTLAAICTACLVGFLPLLFEGVKVPPELLEKLWLLNLCGELYVLAVASAVEGGFMKALAAVAALALATGGVYRLSRRAYRHVLMATAGGALPASSPRTTGGGLVLRLPGLGDDTALVASNQLRVALRTVGGKTALLQPTLMVVVFGALLLRTESALPAFLASSTSLLLLLGAAGLATLSPMNLQFNQFAVDGNGATQIALLPLGAGSVVHGKATAFLLLGAAGLAPAAIVAVLFTRPAPARALAEIAAVYLILVSSQLLVAPVAAAASALLPRRVNLDKPFTESQPHSLAVAASLLSGLLAVSLAGALTVAGVLVFDSRWVALFLLLLWCVATFLVARILLPAATGLYRHRREAILLAAQGR